MKQYIFLEGGKAPDLGEFNKGETRALDPNEVELHEKRGLIKLVEKLQRDELVYWLMDRKINPPDKATKPDLQKLLIHGEEERAPDKDKKHEEVTSDV